MHVVAMIHVYMDLREGESILVDHDGMDVPDVATATQLAINAARDVMREDILQGVFSLDGAVIVRSADDTILLDLPFADAVRLNGLVPAPGTRCNRV